MKSWLIAPLFLLQPLAEPPADAPPSCFDLPADQRAACEAQETPPPIPDSTARDKDVMPPDDTPMRNGEEFSSPGTFSDKQEGGPQF